MLVSLLRLAARHPLKFAALSLSAPLLGLLAVASRGAPAAPVAIQSPELLTERLWLDSYPEKPTDKVAIAYFLEDNEFGIFRSGSSYRFQIDVLEYAAKGDRLNVTFLEDNKKKDARFAIKACNDKPPFDLCLTFDKSPFGPAKFYGFKDSDQAARRMPWLKAEMQRALPARKP